MKTKRRTRTWRVLSWLNEPVEKGPPLPLICVCGRDAECPAGVLLDGAIVGVVGTSLLFDPPEFKPQAGFVPDAIQCRRCGRIYRENAEEALDSTDEQSQSNLEVEHVR